MAAARPSPTSLASSAAKLLSATAAPAVEPAAAPPVAAPQPATAGTPNTTTAAATTDAAAQLEATTQLPDRPLPPREPGVQNTAARALSPSGSVPEQTPSPSGIVPRRAASPSGTPPPPAASPIGDTSATQPGLAAPKLRAAGRTSPARRWRLAGFLLAVVLVAAVVAVTLGIRHSPAVTASAGKPGAAQGLTASGQQISAEAAARAAAVTWVTNQVGRDIIIACDTVICSDLAQHDFPAGNLTVLQPTAPDPYGSELVIATADVRSQFGSRLAAVYAPEVIASFGTGPNRIDVRVMAPHGPAAFQAALRADLLARKAYGAQLLRNHRIRTSATARAHLAAGQVDERLLTIIAFMAHQQPLDIVDIGSVAPGANPSVPLRFADLAVAKVAAHLTSAAYQRALITLAHSEVAPYVPLSVGPVRLADGRTVLRIEFAAPSPVGLTS